MEKPAREKHSSLWRKFLNYGRKKFYNIVSDEEINDFNTDNTAIVADSKRLSRI